MGRETFETEVYKTVYKTISLPGVRREQSEVSD